jgi:hypothetical protein
MVHASDDAKNRRHAVRAYSAVEEARNLIRKELAALREQRELTPSLVFQDACMLDFLELADAYSEKDLESAILREIERFLLEVGSVSLSSSGRSASLLMAMTTISICCSFIGACGDSCHRAEDRRLQTRILGSDGVVLRRSIFLP